MLTPKVRIKEKLMLLNIIQLYFQGVCLEHELLSLKATLFCIYMSISKIRFTDT